MTLSDPCYVLTLGILQFTKLQNITVSFHSPHYFIFFILVVVFYYGLIFYLVCLLVSVLSQVTVGFRASEYNMNVVSFLPLLKLSCVLHYI